VSARYGRIVQPNKFELAINFKAAKVLEIHCPARKPAGRVGGPYESNGGASKFFDFLSVHTCTCAIAGEAGAVGLSRMPMARNRRVTTLP
jgi:hypothetical protein